jgi:sugar lactone lactonase YvrE
MTTGSSRLAAALLLALGCSESMPASGGGAPAGQISEQAVGMRPESVTRGFGDKLYVSVQNSNDVMLDDGEIKVVSGDTVTTFVSGLKEPKGIAFTGSHLVVTDLTRVWAIDSTGAKKILAEGAAFPFPTAFFNDTAAEPGGKAVFVTEMGQRSKIRDPMTTALWPTGSTQAAEIMPEARIYRITVPEGQVTVAVDATADMLVVNGVTAPAPDRLLVAEFFLGNILEKTAAGMKKLASGYRGADGIEQDEAGNIYVSSFEQGMVWKLDRAGQNEQVLLKDRGKGSTADFFLDRANKRLIVPDTAKGSLITIPL